MSFQENATTERPRPQVFVVDKDVHLRRLLADFLVDISFEPKFFDDGYSALDEVRRTRPSLVITEVLVPQLDGLALCQLIKSDTTMLSVKVLVLSVLSAEERSQGCRADAFMKKPIERSRLVGKIRSLIDVAPDDEKKEEKENERPDQHRKP